MGNLGSKKDIQHEPESGEKEKEKEERGGGQLLGLKPSCTPNEEFGPGGGGGQGRGEREREFSRSEERRKERGRGASFAPFCSLPYKPHTQVFRF